jgi:hypothetical protein
VIFPTNVWEYDVLDHFPFKDLDAAKKRAKRIEQAAPPWRPGAGAAVAPR